ncbi:MAG: LCP family protein [Oscillospiraceae bacterium]|nr:LCP family protein [Oscillospiraceae bacterium]
MNKKKKIQNYAIPLLALFALASLFFVYVIFVSQMIPYRLAVIVSVFLILLLMLCTSLSLNKKTATAKIVGCCVSAIFSLALIIGGFAILRGVQTMKRITETKKEVSAICVYMRAEDSTDASELRADMQYGIMEVQDRENTDSAIATLETELGSPLQLRLYPGLSKLVDALLDKEVDAIIINSAFLDLLDDIEGYEGVAAKLREISKTHVEKEVPAEQKEKTKFKLPFFGTKKEEDSLAKKPFALYISGIDSRVGLIEKSRCDVNILAVVNSETHQVALITTPRDYYVPLSISNGIPDKLTHAGMYGVDVSVDTLGMLYGLDIDYYFRVNFQGYINIVDAMGGVTVYVDKGFSTMAYNYPEGYIELKGNQALDFVRHRKYIGDSGRAKNQLALIKGVIKKASSTDMLLNFSQILSAAEGAFETNMPYDVMSQLVRDQIESGAEWNVVMYAVQGRGNSRIPYSMSESVYVSIPIQETVDDAKELIRQVYAGEIITQPEARVYYD